MLHSVEKAYVSHEVFFWLGAKSSQDEQGTAALLAIDLDDKALAGAAVQSREPQGHESPEFKGVFKRARYLEGGVKSGFNKVDRDAHQDRLFHLKGRNHVTVTQVPMVTKSLNSGDVFVLELKGVIYQWNGKDANQAEKSKALDFCRELRDEIQKGKAKIEAVDEGSEPPAFWSKLGGKSAIQAATADDDNSNVLPPTLYRCSDVSGSLKVRGHPPGDKGEGGREG